MRVRVSILTFLLITSCAVAQDNLLPGGDFEDRGEGLGGWMFSVWSTKPSRGEFRWTEPHSGERAAGMAGVENVGTEAVRSVLISPPVAVPEGLLKLTGFYRASEAAKAGIQVQLFAQLPDPTDFAAPVAKTLHIALGDDEAWTPFEFDVNIRPGIKAVRIVLRAHDLGVVSFDDLALEAVTEPLTLRLYPAEYGRGDAWPLVQGAPNFVRIMLMGDRSRIEQAELLLDLPAGVGDFGLLGEGTPVTGDEEELTRYRIELSDQLLAGMRSTVSHCGLTLWLEAGEVAEGAAAYVQPVVDGEELGRKRVSLNVLPPLPDGARPTRYKGFFCWSLFHDVPEPLRAQVYDMVRGMGVTHRLAQREPTGWRAYLQDRLRAEGGGLWANIPGDYLKLIRGPGAETRIIAQGTAAFEPYADHYRELSPVIEGVFWDWEPANAWRNPLWDDPETVAAFAEHEQIDPATLTLERLQGELRERFLAFRTWQLSQVVRLWAQHVHSIRPDLDIAICQGSGMPPDRHVDYRAYDDIPNLIHLPMIYTSSPMAFARNVEGMRDYLPDAKLWPMTNTGMLADAGGSAAKSPRSIYFDVITPALLGSVGYSHWPDLVRGMDMEYVWEINHAMRDLALVEDFVFDGEREPEGATLRVLPESETQVQTATGMLTITSPQWDRFALPFVYQHEDETLAVVCNMHPDRPATALVTVADAPAGEWRAYDPVSREALTPAGGQTWTAQELASGVHFEVPPLQAGMLVLSRQAPDGGFSGTVSEAGIRERFAARSAETQARGGAGTIHEGDLTIDWADVDGDGGAELHVASADQDLGFAQSGNLWSWRIGEDGPELVNRFDGSGFCEDRFWWPEEARASTDGRAEYELVAREVKAGRATVSFRRRLTHAVLGGLLLEKTWTIPATGTRVQVTITVRNESPDVHEFSYWSHGALQVGAMPTLAVTTTDGQQTYAGQEQPREVWAVMAGVPEDQGGLPGKDVTATLTEPAFTLGAPDGPRITVGAEPALMQLYRWWDGSDQGRYTLEWMYRRQTLASGESWTTRYELSAAD